MWRLTKLAGNANPSVVDMTGTVTIGRGSDNDVRLDSYTASRHHARFLLVEDHVELEDLSAANGSFVNGHKITRTPLAVGDVCRFGGVELRLDRIDDVQTASDTPSSRRLTPHPRHSRRTTLHEATSSLLGESAQEAEQALALEMVQVMKHATDSGRRATKFAKFAVRRLEAQTAMVLVRILDGGHCVCAARAPAGAKRSLADVPRSLVARVEAGGGTADTGAVLHSEGDGEQDRRRVSMVCAPLEARGAIVGFLYLERSADYPAFTGADLVLLTHLVRQGSRHLADDLLKIQAEQVREWEHGPHDGTDAPQLMGHSPGFIRMMRAVESNALDPGRVLVEGERGSGRRLLARYLHASSPNSKGPFVVAHCPSLTPDLGSAALFGKREGPDQDSGFFLQATGGTLCIADVAHLSHPCQSQLAHALSTGKFWPVGDSGATQRVRCQVVATSAESLERLTADGRLLPILHSELASCVIHVPALRERKDDVQLLGRHFAALHGRRLFGHVVQVDDKALRMLVTYDWPGNVAEIGNVMERATMLCEGEGIHPRHLPDDVVSTARGERPPDYTLKAAEKAAIVRALNETDWKKGAAKTLLGVSWPWLTRRYREFRLDDFVRED